MSAWQIICRDLWGDDWIAPFSKVMQVNRRTVERWKSAEVEIPDRVVKQLEAVHHRVSPYARAYGEILRSIAKGETPDDIRRDLIELKRALARFEAELKSNDPVARKAANEE